MSRQHRICALALALSLAACDDGPQEPGGSLTGEEAEDLAAEISELGYADVAGEFEAPAFASAAGDGPETTPPIEVTRTFEWIRPCSLGGQIAVAGTSVGVIDRENHHFIIETEATRTHTDCVLPLRRGERSIELDGAPHVAMSARFERQDGMPSGPQTMSFAGAVDWQIVDSDRSGTCEIDVDVVWERTESGGTKTVDGVVCGREIHVQTTWSREADD